MDNLDLGKAAFIAFNLSLPKKQSAAFPATRDKLESLWNTTLEEERKAAWQDAALKAIEVSNGKA
ncbi:hypothetical protein [Nostoc sp. GT001]|uniref:hypothetical protein n=1 Tax=Nostoc sp. GT001 TaxID=3056647 RepID=UPI0025AB1DC4|nr:hypothetical protein [Nostoc sp. GT001]MDM9583088.1 hypothetical protein [Nostoc sp. GT001]